MTEHNHYITRVEMGPNPEDVTFELHFHNGWDPGFLFFRGKSFYIVFTGFTTQEAAAKKLKELVAYPIVTNRWSYDDNGNEEILGW